MSSNTSERREAIGDVCTELGNVTRSAVSVLGVELLTRMEEHYRLQLESVEPERLVVRQQLLMQVRVLLNVFRGEPNANPLI